jgi:hypothetical protein
VARAEPRLAAEAIDLLLAADSNCRSASTNSATLSKPFLVTFFAVSRTESRYDSKSLLL